MGPPPGRGLKQSGGWGWSGWEDGGWLRVRRARGEAAPGTGAGAAGEMGLEQSGGMGAGSA